MERNALERDPESTLPETNGVHTQYARSASLSNGNSYHMAPEPIAEPHGLFRISGSLKYPRVAFKMHVVCVCGHTTYASRCPRISNHIIRNVSA